MSGITEQVIKIGLKNNIPKKNENHTGAFYIQFRRPKRDSSPHLHIKLGTLKSNMIYCCSSLSKLCLEPLKDQQKRITSNFSSYSILQK